MGARRDRLDGRMANATATRRKKSPIKTKERARREAKMLAVLKKGELPYTPAVMSWLSRKLDKPAGKITQDEIRALLA